MRPLKINAPALDWSEVSPMEARRNARVARQVAIRNARPAPVSFWSRVAAFLGL